MKKLFTTCIIVALIFTFTGCGKQAVKENESIQPNITIASEKIEEKTPNTPSINKVTEEVMEETTEEETKVNTEDATEEANENPTEETIEEEMEEEISTTIPNLEEYWELNRFNLYQYLSDCGVTSITSETDDLGPDISYIEATLGNWTIDIYTERYEQCANLFVKNSDPTIGNCFKSFDYDGDQKTMIYIIVDDNGTMVHQATIEALDEVINTIINHPNEAIQLEGWIH